MSWLWPFGSISDSALKKSSRADNGIKLETHKELTEEEKKKMQAKAAKEACRYIKHQKKDELKKHLQAVKEHEYLNFEHILLKEYVRSVGKTKVHNSPLSFACETSSAEICECIFDFVAETCWFSREDACGVTAIHCAAINPSDEILKLLYHKYPEFIKQNIDIQDQTTKSTPLHYACKYRSIQSVNWLLSNNAQFHLKNKDGELPLHWAAGGGNKETFNAIFDKYKKKNVESVKTIETDDLEVITIEKDNDSRNEYSKDEMIGEDCLKIEANRLGVPLLYAAKALNFECIDTILDRQKYSDATARDEECDTVLHFVCKDANPQQLMKILKANALLGAKNEVGNTPLDWISHNTMKELLNNQTAKENINIRKGDTFQKDNYEIVFKNPFGHHASGSDMKNILSLAKSPKHEDLALHPLCQSIVSVKWQKMKKYFMLKLLFYIPFVVLLSVYPLLFTEKMKAGNDTQLATALENKIDATYYTLYALLIVQIVFGCLSVFVMISPFWKESKTYLTQWNTKRLKRLLEYYYFELLWSDWYEYIIWVLAFLLLHDQISHIPVVVASWFSLFFVCSNHPSILPFRFILVKILFRYIKFLIFAFGLISGFAMGFYFLLQGCLLADENQCGNGAFQTIYSTALKVPAMMMGEISFEGFSLDHAFPYVYLLFGAFIFLITCCLFNMMNGLAINITQELMQKAHIFKTIAECEMIYEFETLLTEVSAWITWFGMKNISFLSPLWIESLKASPSSGKCKNLDEYNEQIHENINLEDDSTQFSCISKDDETRWIWLDRGYELDRKIIHDAKEILDCKSHNLIHNSDDESDDDEFEINNSANGKPPQITVTQPGENKQLPVEHVKSMQPLGAFSTASSVNMSDEGDDTENNPFLS